jgi:hypothetical protein
LDPSWRPWINKSIETIASKAKNEKRGEKMQDKEPWPTAPASSPRWTSSAGLKSQVPRSLRWGCTELGGIKHMCTAGVVAVAAAAGHLTPFSFRRRASDG